MTNAFRPLDGIVVLDLSRYLPGPFLTRILADMGAQVIKVEPPTGDSLRWMPPSKDGVGLTYASLNAGKQSIAVDLKKPEAQALIRALVPKADVLIEGYRPGVLARLGLDWAHLHELNPKLVGCSLSGYGQDGPNAQRAGHDLSYVGHAGVLGLFGPAGQPPTVPGVQLADVAGGTLPAAIGVLGALMERERTGKGRHLDIALAKGVLGFATYAMASAAAGFSEPRGAGPLTGGAPCCRCYRTKDGRYMAFSPLEPHFYDTFCTLAERPDLAGKGYAQGDDAPVVMAELESVFAARTQAEWVELLDGHDVCCEAVRSPAEALADPYYEGIVKEVGGRPVVQMPIGVPPEDLVDPTPLPVLGADGPAVFDQFGVDASLVDAARQAGALVVP